MGRGLQGGSADRCPDCTAAQYGAGYGALAGGRRAGKYKEVEPASLARYIDLALGFRRQVGSRCKIWAGPGARCGRVPAPMWAGPGADVGGSRRRCGQVPAQMWASPGARLSRD